MMGAWSHEPFGNDTACDWAYELEESSGFSFIESTLDKAIAEANDYLESTEGEEAVAAIEVIAKLMDKGTQSDSYTESVELWISKNKQTPSPELVDKALKVIELLLSENSELVELWEGQEEWFESVNKLKLAISAS
ncbi:DUF4259 domain-containing protein [Pleionea sp. CnH1-48]|uniref:DUF4259 domain-containing protein n=1 Tax=Pleionea sp. CnH1-48 TaxID=2954494 RepID=UPI00209721BF|nr:DUF4259 domain-containing protein [Pleionea sp. CnH1-48]MCO7224128.1 DUF4259 domain-containing protein [Pleionea sp. CnH1-48]